jgi:serine/threonine protein kinase
MVLSLIFEHVNQDLDAYLRNCPPPGLEPGRIQDIMFQLLHGVDFLHSHRIVHRDLKPQNLLVTRDGVVKITDFGLARIYDFYTLLTSVVVTLWYRSPEVLMCLSYDTSVDLWALGCIFAELHTRTALFEGQHERHQLSLIFGTIGTPSEDEWPEKANVMRSNFLAYPKQAWTVKVPTLEPQGQDLLDKLLQFHPDQRISASEAMKHPYFCDVQVSTAAPSSGGA